MIGKLAPSPTKWSPQHAHTKTAAINTPPHHCTQSFAEENREHANASCMPAPLMFNAAKNALRSVWEGLGHAHYAALPLELVI